MTASKRFAPLFVTLAAALSLAQPAQAQDSARSEAAQAQVERALRTEGLDHLLPDGHKTTVQDPTARARVVAELQRARSSQELDTVRAELGGALLQAQATQRVDRGLGLSRAQVLAELRDARLQGEMDFARAEIGLLPAPASQRRDLRLAGR